MALQITMKASEAKSQGELGVKSLGGGFYQHLGTGLEFARTNNVEILMDGFVAFSNNFSKCLGCSGDLAKLVIGQSLTSEGRINIAKLNTILNKFRTIEGTLDGVYEDGKESTIHLKTRFTGTGNDEFPKIFAVNFPMNGLFGNVIPAIPGLLASDELQFYGWASITGTTTYDQQINAVAAALQIDGISGSESNLNAMAKAAKWYKSRFGTHVSSIMRMSCLSPASNKYSIITDSVAGDSLLALPYTMLELDGVNYRIPTLFAEELYYDTSGKCSYKYGGLSFSIETSELESLEENSGQNKAIKRFFQNFIKYSETFKATGVTGHYRLSNYINHTSSNDLYSRVESYGQYDASILGSSMPKQYRRLLSGTLNPVMSYDITEKVKRAPNNIYRLESTIELSSDPETRRQQIAELEKDKSYKHSTVMAFQPWSILYPGNLHGLVYTIVQAAGKFEGVLPLELGLALGGESWAEDISLGKAEVLGNKFLAEIGPV